MSKSKLVDAIADGFTSKAEAGRAVDAVTAGIAKILKSGDSVEFQGFGTFKVIDRPERQGRNPSTGEAITIRAKKAVKFGSKIDV